MLVNFLSHTWISVFGALASWLTTSSSNLEGHAWLWVSADNLGIFFFFWNQDRRTVDLQPMFYFGLLLL